jgi:competence protein ComEC
MSFAATLALIAVYTHGLPLTRAGLDSSLGARAALWGTNEIISLVVASLVAGLATTPCAAFHFHRIAPYGVLANLLAMPVVSAWVMPMGILGVIAIPFGFDGIFWRQMDYGIEWMDAIALWVTSLPGAFGRVTSFGTGPLLLATAGLLLIGLLKTPLRWSGVAFVVAATIVAARTPVPDILVAADGRTFAVRGADGKLAIHHTGGDTFATREWLAADADGRDPSDKALGAGIACDPSGCIGMLDDRRLVSYVIAPDAFEEDCRHAAIIVATRDAPPDCDAKVIGRHDWREHGALALYRNGSGFVIESTRPPNFDRPWAPRAPPRAASAPSQDTARQSAGGHARAVTRLDAAVRGSSGG